MHVKPRRVEFFGVLAVGVGIAYFVLIFLAATQGPWAWILLAVATAVLLAAGAWAFLGRRPPPPELRRARPADASVYRVVVVADANCPSEDVRATLLERAAGRETEALVVAPTLASKLDRLTGDERAYEAAQRRLESALAELRRAGIDARGHIGAHDPIQAADDGLREFAAEELIIVSDPRAEESAFGEDVVETAQLRFDLPVTGIQLGSR